MEDAGYLRVRQVEEPFYHNETATSLPDPSFNRELLYPVSRTTQHKGRTTPMNARDNKDTTTAAVTPKTDTPYGDSLDTTKTPHHDSSWANREPEHWLQRPNIIPRNGNLPEAAVEIFSGQYLTIIAKQGKVLVFCDANGNLHFHHTNGELTITDGRA